MRVRGDDPERIRQRLERAEQEVEAAAGLPYVTVVNDDLSATVTTVEGLIQAARDSGALRISRGSRGDGGE